ncbi:phosphotransacetylase [Candidatus Mycoplasma mahonii]|uniref:phosphotransacetylase n=1 Tax=Candidatus Mycoplasma mahonii TaxID=3004105 RepID=UPI0026EE17C5|nr:phosphotransacetylase [Candidatus Mycoplasma mahonii]WKX02584.1 phosphotransacetylase [Candidatus Mycoplasma mahonii]
MTFKKYIVNKLNEKSGDSKKKILFMDGNDTRAQNAAYLHAADGHLEPILLVETNAEKEKLHGTIISIEEWNNNQDILIKKYVERRKGKESEEQAKMVVNKKPIFAMLMLELGEVDGVIGGLVDTSAVVLSSAFKVIGPKPEIKTISSVMLMEKAHEWYIFSDISVNIVPTKDQLVDIAKNASMFAEALDFKTKIAFLSFSTSGSAVHERSTMVREATVKFNDDYKPAYTAIGEIQFDAAFSPEVRKLKYKYKGFPKNPTIFIFPSLEAGNIGYKIAQRMGGFGAIGPIITGINKPVNDLSRGAETIDVYNTALVTALQTFN